MPINEKIQDFKGLFLKGSGLLNDSGTEVIGTGGLNGILGATTPAAATVTTLQGTDLNAGSSGVAGTLDIFPTTAAKGKIAFTATDSTGNTTTTITNAAQAGAVTYTIPDAGASASFVMTQGSQTISGTKTIAALVTTNLDAGASGTAGTVDIFPTTASKGKLAMSVTDQTGDTTVSLVIGAMAAARTITLADPLGAANLVTSTGICSPQWTRCTAQLDKTSSTTLSDVAGCLQTVVVGTYEFEIHLPGTSTVNGGMKASFKYTTAVASTLNADSMKFTTTAHTLEKSTTATDEASFIAETAAIVTAVVRGTMIVTTGGTVQLRFAQNASHADTSSVYVGAKMRFTRIS